MHLDRSELHLLTKIRRLPYRSFDVNTGAWAVKHVTENWEAAKRLGLDFSSIKKPTNPGTIVDVRGKNLAITISGTADNLQHLRSFPDHRSWNKTDEVWVVKPTRRNVDHLKKYFPNLPWSQSAQDLVVRTEAPFVQDKTQLNDLIVRSVRDFPFKTTPYKHQLEAFSLGRDAEAFAYFMEQGTGKTKVTLDNAGFLFQTRVIRGLFVVCPKSVKSTWEEEIDIHLPDWVDREVLVWNSGKTKDENVRAMDQSGDKLAIFIMNIDVFSSGSGLGVAKTFLTLFPSMFVVDESSRIKTPSAKRTRACIALGKLAKYRRILTGTPVTQSPLDLFTQFKFLDENVLGFGSFYAFRNRYAIMGGWQNKQVLRFVNMTELQDTIGPYSYRVTKDECLDLPDRVYRKLVIQLSPEQRRVYNDLVENMSAEIEGTGSISAVLALTLLLRLQQVVGGFIPSSEDERGRGITYRPIPGPNPKLEAFMEDIEDVGGKVLVWARFRAELDMLARALREKYGAAQVGEFHGGIKEDERTRLRRAFQEPDNELRFLVLQIDTGGVGLTFTQADKAYYFSNGFSLESRLQSEARNHRSGSEIHQHVTYTDIIAQDTLDPKFLRVLRNKLSLANVVTGDNWREWV